jgi:anti-anti-sigma factor
VSLDRIDGADRADHPDGPEVGGVTFAVLGSRIEIVLDGEIDQSMERELLECLDAVPEGVQAIRLDARTVTFMDSVGIALVGRLVSRAPVLMPDPPEQVRYLLDAGGLLAHVTIDEGAPA